MQINNSETDKLQSAVLEESSYSADQELDSTSVYLIALNLWRRRAAAFPVLQQSSGAVDEMPEAILHGLPQAFELAFQLLAHLLHLSADQTLQQLLAAAQGRAHVSHLLRCAQGLGTEGEGHQTLTARDMMGQEALPLFLRRRRVVISYYRKS